jgi:hypothetical protein
MAATRRAGIMGAHPTAVMHRDPDSLEPAAYARFTAALQHYYAVTLGLRPLQPAEGCPCCVDPADSQRLFAVAREQADAELVGRFALKSMTTWGDERDFRWWLPRLVAESASGVCGIEWPLLAEKAVAAGCATWPAEERSALFACLDALWLRAFAGEYVVGETVYELLCAVSVLGIDLEPRWRMLLEPRTPQFPPLLAEIVGCVFGMEGTPAALQTLARSPATLQGLRADLAFAEDETATQLVTAAIALAERP